MEVAIGSRKKAVAGFFYQTRFFWVGIFMAAVIWFTIWPLRSIMSPAVVQMTTSHNVYVSANVEVVENFTNLFVTGAGWFGGAGGIATSQVERTLRVFKEK